MKKLRAQRFVRGLLALAFVSSSLWVGCGDSHNTYVATGSSGSAVVPAVTSYSDLAYGSGALGSVTLQGDTNWATQGLPGGGVVDFTNLTIPAGVTLTVPSGTTIRCTETFTCEGTVVVEPWTPGIAAGSLVQETEEVAPIISVPFGITGEGPSDNVVHQGLPLSRAQLLFKVPDRGGTPGAGMFIPKNFGGNDSIEVDCDASGGAGGGVFAVHAQEGIVNKGSIRANGGHGKSGIRDFWRNFQTQELTAVQTLSGGGGGGGVILLSWGPGATYSGNGTLEAKGGNGGDGRELYPGVPNGQSAGGGGGGGIIRLIGPGATAVGDVSGGAAVTDITQGDNLDDYNTGGGGPSGGSGGRPARNVIDEVHQAEPGGTGLVVVSAIDDPTSALVRARQAIGQQ